jgi:hypothetical protein
LSQNGNGRVTYTEVRRMARWLGVFTARDLADALRVQEEIGDDFITALAWHGLLLPEEHYIIGPDGTEEPIYEMDPLPERHYPRNRYTPPEIVAVIETGGLLLYNHRGIAVRLSNKGEKGRVMSTPGARQKQKLRDLAWERMQRAIRSRIEKERARRIAASQGRVIEADEHRQAIRAMKRKGKKAGRRMK